MTSFTTRTKTFTRSGQLDATLVETDDGRVLTQSWTHADGRREVNLRLSQISPFDPATQDDIEALIAAWRAACDQPGFTDASGRGEQWAREFLATTRGWGVLHARAAR